MKKTILLIMAVLLLFPVGAFAYRFGVGGYTDDISRGLELALWVDAGENSQWFVAPHGWGIYYFDDDDPDDVGDGYYSIGLKTGFAFAKDKWISPLVGLGGGYSYNSGSHSAYREYEDGYYEGYQYLDYTYGGRVFAGLSFAPFDVLSEEVEWLSWTEVLSGLLFTFESGVQYSYNYHRGTNYYQDEEGEHTETYTSEDQSIGFPDFGFGISFNW